MATQVRHPIWLPAVRTPGARTFALLYAVESFARASIASVIPIQAYELLKDERAVSLLYTAVSLLGLSITLFMPLLIRRLARRRVYTLGAAALIAGSLFLLDRSLFGQLFGMLLRVGGTSALAITLNLYIMDHIRKTDFVRVESQRMAFSTLAWTGGPALGVYLYTTFGIAAAHGVVIVVAMILLALFWYFRLGDNPVIAPGRTRPAGPFSNVGRFWAQPRLRVAWLIAFGRSCFWTTLFIYGPILMLVSGQGRLAGGLLVSAANALLFSAILWGRLGARFGARRTMAACFSVMTVTLVVAALSGEASPLFTAAMLLVCTFFCIALDALGSSVFMRAVHPYERAEMTAVYRTYLDLSEITPPLVYSFVLIWFGLGGVFGALAVFTALCGWITWRYLPRRI